MYPLALALALTLTADAKPSDTKANDGAMKNLVKDAVTAGANESNAKPHNEATDGPDVSKMTFSKDAVFKVVTFNQPRIQTCYEESLAVKDKAVEGTLNTSWTITPEGMVKGAKIEKKGTTLKDAKLHDCVVAVLSAMTFPVTSDGKSVPITYPFNLKAVR
jgi:hypothetical protein